MSYSISGGHSRYRRRKNGKRGRHATAALVSASFDSHLNSMRNRIAADNCTEVMLACVRKAQDLAPTHGINPLAIEDITHNVNSHSVYVPSLLYCLIPDMERYSDLSLQTTVNKLAGWVDMTPPLVESGGILAHIPAAKEQMSRLLCLPIRKLRYLYRMFPTIFAVIQREEWVRDASSPGEVSGTRKDYSDLNLVCIMIRSLQESAK